MSRHIVLKLHKELWPLIAYEALKSSCPLGAGPIAAEKHFTRPLVQDWPVGLNISSATRENSLAGKSFTELGAAAEFTSTNQLYRNTVDYYFQFWQVQVSVVLA